MLNGWARSRPVNVSCPALPRLFFQFAFFWRIGWARKLHTIAVGIGNRHNPQMVSHKGAFPRLNAPRFELAIKGESVFTHEGDRSACPKRLLWPILRQELLKHDRGIAKLKPAPANFPVSRIVLITIRNPLMLHSESKTINIKPQRRFHVGDAEKRHCLLNVRTCD